MNILYKGDNLLSAITIIELTTCEGLEVMCDAVVYLISETLLLEVVSL